MGGWRLGLCEVLHSAGTTDPRDDDVDNAENKRKN